MKKQTNLESSAIFILIFVVIMGLLAGSLSSCVSSHTKAGCGSYSSWESHTKYRINR